MTNESERPRAIHPIGIVAERTGLTPDVLRVWERRYGAIEPERGGGGQRLYSDADVERLMLLRQAIEAGRGIGSVVKLTMDELSALVRSDQDAGAAKAVGDPIDPDRMDLEEAFDNIRTLNGERLEAILRRAALRSGVARFLEGSLAPLLHKVGDEWHSGRLSVAEEHLATAVVQRVMISVLGSLLPSDDAPAILIAGPAGDRHEMGGLLAAAVAASEGWRVLYLGADLPSEEILGAARVAEVKVVGLSVVYVPDPDVTAREIRVIRDGLPRSTALLIGGGGARGLEEALRHPGTRFINDFEAMRTALRSLVTRPAR